MDKILLRKDIFILVLFMLAVILITEFRSPFSNLLSCGMITLIIVSNEIGLFFTFIPIAVLMLVRECNTHGFRKSVIKALPGLAWLFMPISATAAVILNPGTDRMATIVASSWPHLGDQLMTPRRSFQDPREH